MIFYIVNYIFIIRSKKMTNNLRNLQKDLRAFAKKQKILNTQILHWSHF